MSEPIVTAHMIFGRAEVQSWLEGEVISNGDVRFVAKGRRVDYDEAGRRTNGPVVETGLVMVIPGARPPPVRSWWARLFNPLKGSP